MEKKSIDTRKGLIAALICVIISYAIYQLVPSANRFISNAYIGQFLNEMVFVIAGIASLVVLKRTSILRFKWEGFATGLVVAGFLIFQLLSVSGLMIYRKTTITASAVDVVFFALFTLSVGIAEEVAFRGILLNAFLDHFGSASAKAIRLSIICSAIPFGLVHLLNAFAPDGGWYSSSYQALNCIMSGIIFGAVYYRSKKNLWVCILLHGVNDFVALMASGALTGVIQTDAAEAAVTDKFGSVPVLIALFLVGMWVTRKKKLENVYAE